MTIDQWREILRAAEDLPEVPRADLLEKLQWIAGGMLLMFDHDRVRRFVALVQAAE